uniref:G-protein coupled receptors family 2 profile 2 domain-containing protein n=1 Tax=Amphimedon queenslandica TaxID=400682 RepID=A0A1X7VIB5_AMPQE
MIMDPSAINRLTSFSVILLGLLIPFLLLDSTVGLEACSSKRPDFTLQAPFHSGCTGLELPNCIRTSIQSCRSNGSCLVQKTLNITRMMSLQVGRKYLLETFVENVINLTKRPENMNKNIRTGIMREYTYVCHKVFNESLQDCFAEFIAVCLDLPSHRSPSPCINLLYNHCLNRTKDCREAVENEIEEIIEEECDEDYDDCEELIDDTFNNQFRFNSMKRIGTALRVSSNSKTKNATRLFEKRRKVIRELVGNINNVSSIMDQEDVQILYEVMDSSFNISHVSSLSLSLSDKIGPMLLTNLKEMNIVFGKAILSGGGRIKNDYKFNGNNLGVSFKITDDNDNSFEHSSDEGLSVKINLPRTALCQSMGMKMNKRNNKKDDDDDEEDYDEDVPDRYSNCFTPQFPSNCRYVIMSSITQNIDTLFEEISNRTLLSIISSIQVVSNDTTDVNGMFDLYENISITFNVSKFNNTNPMCHYWNPSLQNWSTDGMTTTMLSSSQVLCTSNHLTSFAVLVDHSGVTSENDDPSISPAEQIGFQVVGYIGCIISIIALLFAIVLLALLRKQLQKGPLLYVHINLSLALLLALLVFVFGIELPRSIPWLCSVLAGSLHYLFLCVFCWSLAEGIMLYILIVRVYGSLADRWYLLLPLGWGLPIIIVGISTGIKHDLYGTNDYCWLSTSKGMIWSFIGPMLFIIIINIILLAMTIYQIMHSKSFKAATGADPNLKKIDLVKTGLKGVLVLSPLLGITWVIGIFAFSQQTTIFLWLFTILNSLQVSIKFIHFVILLR